MARCLALEWNASCARLVVATSRGGRAKVEHVAIVEAPAGGEDPAETLVSLGRAIGEKLSQWKASTRWLNTLVILPRSSIELRVMNVPPSEAGNLAEEVYAAAPRELGIAGEGGTIDFVPLTESTDEPRLVEVAAVSADRLDNLKAICDTAGLTSSKILLRPHATASLARRCAAPSEAVYMLADETSEETELTVVADGKVVLSRGVRMPGAVEPEKRESQLLAEIRRTAMAAQNQPLGGAIEALYLIQPLSNQGAIADQIADELFPVRVVDLSKACRVSGRVAKDTPQDIDQFAPLLGAIADEFDRVRPAIDFLNPRRPPQKTTNRRPWIAATAAAAAIVALWFLAWRQTSAVDREIEALARQSKELDRAVDRAVETQQSAEAIRIWKAGDVAWLDELRELSERFPSARDAVLLRLTMARSLAGGGGMELEGLVRDPSIVGRIERDLRDAHHEVRSKRAVATLREQSYTWQFESSVSVARREKSDYLTTAEGIPPEEVNSDEPQRRPEVETDVQESVRLPPGNVSRTTQRP